MFVLDEDTTEELVASSENDLRPDISEMRKFLDIVQNNLLSDPDQG